jgi:hypothetical protein
VSTLGLGGNALGDEGAATLAEALPSMPGLTTLWLDNNAIGDAGASDLAAALPSAPHLEWLALDAYWPPESIRTIRLDGPASSRAQVAGSAR